MFMVFYEDWAHSICVNMNYYVPYTVVHHAPDGAPGRSKSAQQPFCPTPGYPI